jgi:hypothetical protein
MQAQRDELIALAAANGWAATKTDNFDAHDWSVETWELESLWSPVGVKAYVTFPIDPQAYRERRPWAIQVTAEPPAYGENSSDHFETSLIQWKNDKQDLVTFLDRIRRRREPDETTDLVPDASKNQK